LTLTTPVCDNQKGRFGTPGGAVEEQDKKDLEKVGQGIALVGTVVAGLFKLLQKPKDQR
jgi:hypothetical protein